MKPTPSTGEIWIADLDPVRGSEQGRRRPVVAFQNPGLALFTTTTLSIPLTTNLARKGIVGTCFLRHDNGGRQCLKCCSFRAKRTSIRSGR